MPNAYHELSSNHVARNAAEHILGTANNRKERADQDHLYYDSALEMKLRFEFVLLVTVIAAMLAVNLIRGLMGMGWNW